MKLQLKNVTLVIIDCINLERAQIALDICQKFIDFADVKLLTHFKAEDIRIVNIGKIDSVKKYSTFCIKELNNYVDTEYCLLVQYDGFILNPNNWSNDFLNYDYIGCADINREETLVDKNDDRLVGNGGFSLRSKKLLEVLQKSENIKTDTEYGEDYMISFLYRDFLKENGISFAQKDVADRFATNTSISKTLSQNITSFGFHGLCIDLIYFLKVNPEFKVIKKYFEKDLFFLKFIYYKTHFFFMKIPYFNRLFKYLLLLIKRAYYKYFY